MKKQIIRAIMVFGFVFGLTSVMQAQVAEQYRANIPFDFSIGKKNFQAGSYVLEVRGFESKYVVVKDAKGRNLFAGAPSASGDAGFSRKAALDFRQYGGRHVLETVRISSLVLNAPKSPVRERYLVKNAEPGKVTTVALSTRK